MIIARQSTARTVMVGPILDADGVAVTDGVIGDLKLSKNGGVPAALDGSATLTHRATGHYSLALTANDLDTVGQAEVIIDDTTNAMPVKVLTVIEEAVYDALFAASATGKLPATLAAADVTGNLPADAVAISGSTDAANNAEIVFDTDFAANYDATNDGWVVKLGNYAQGGASAAVTLASLTVNGAFLVSEGTTFTRTGGSGFTCTNSAVNGNGMFVSGQGNGHGLVAVGGTTGSDIVADIVGNITGNLSGSVGSVTGAVGSVTGNVGGNVTGSVGSVAANGIAAASFAADVDAEILSYLVDDATRIDASALNTASAAIGSDGSGLTEAGGTGDHLTALATAASIAALNDLSTSDIDARLAAIRLDELLAADSDIDGAAPPTVGSVFHELMSKTAGSFTFDQTTDSLEAIRDRGDAAWITATSVTVSDKTGFSLAAGGLDAVTLPANLITATSIAADAITSDKVAASVHQELIELAFTYDATATYASADAGSLVKQIADNAGGSALTAADIADAVWEEAIADHSGTTGSTAEALNAAGSAGDPWTTQLPGAYGAGSAGKIIGDNVNATISSRASQTSVDTIDDFLDTEIAAILADTNELQTDWADGGRLDLILDARASQASVDTIDDLIDTEITTIITHLTDIKGATFSGATDSLEAIRNQGDAAWITATGFSTHSAADVWTAGTRTLTAGTNIVLAKGTGITGFNDLDAAGVRTAVGLAAANLDTQLGDLPTNAELTTAITTGLTTALTEGYRGTGATGSVRDLLYEVIAHLGNSGIAGTTKTAYKLDKTTPAKTYLLDDDTVPTAVEELS